MGIRCADMIIAEEAKSEPVQSADGVTGRMRKHLKVDLASTVDKVDARINQTDAKIVSAVGKLTEQQEQAQEKMETAMGEAQEKMEAEIGKVAAEMAELKGMMAKLLDQTSVYA